MNKRDFLKTSAVSAIALSVPAFASSVSNFGLLGLDKTIDSNGKYVLPSLNYAYDALEPYIDSQTMTLHHSKHHQGYVNGLNNAYSKISEATLSGDFSTIKHWERELAFNGGGHFLHTIFWNVMSPKQGLRSKTLDKYFEKSFGSFDNFIKLFKAASTAVEGSGWGILSYEPVADKLVVMQAERQGNLTQWITLPLLPVDVWEHAYYLKYQNRRSDYIDAFLKVVNWDYVSSQFDLMLKMYGK